MYCPKCSQPQVSDKVQFCSRCGLPLLNLKEMVSTEGKTWLKTSNKDKDILSSRQKGTRQGVMLMLLSVILIPAYILLAALFPANDRLIESSVSDTPFEKMAQALLLTIFLLGLARLLYARIFQSAAVDEKHSPIHLETYATYSLPAAPGTPVTGLGGWRQNTGEIANNRERN
jgi:hypothetical protein